MTSRSWEPSPPRRRARDSIEMCRLAMGADFVDRNCVLYSVVNTNAPLVLDRTMLLALKEYARAGQCTVVSPFVLGGAMSPVTVAATLAQVLAEVMASVSLIQLIRPGAPSVFGTFFSPLSLQTGSPTFGSPEGIQFQMCARTLADRLGLPFHSVGALTASKVPDAQAGFESQSQLMGAVLAGVHFIIHATGCLEGLLTMGYEKTVMDADRCGGDGEVHRGRGHLPPRTGASMLSRKSGQVSTSWEAAIRSRISSRRSGAANCPTMAHSNNGRPKGRSGTTRAPRRPFAASSANSSRRPWMWQSGKVSTILSRVEAGRSPARVTVDRTGIRTQEGIDVMTTTDWSLEGTAWRRDRYYARDAAKFVPFREPIVFRRGSMQYLWDNEGRKYIDLLGMNVCISVGHSHPRVVDAAMQQAPGPHSLDHDVLSSGSRPSRRGDFPDLPRGGGIEWVAHFTSSGAEAVDLALTMARRHAGVADIIALRSGYHGPTLGAQSVTGISGFRHGPGLPGNVVFVADPNQYRGVFGPGVKPYLDDIDGQSTRQRPAALPG